MAEEIVVFDIDGTLADVSERIHHIKKKPKPGTRFYMEWHRPRPSIQWCSYVTSYTRPRSEFSYAPEGTKRTGHGRSNGWLHRESIITS